MRWEWHFGSLYFESRHVVNILVVNKSTYTANNNSKVHKKMKKEKKCAPKTNPDLFRGTVSISEHGKCNKYIFKFWARVALALHSK